MFKSHLLNWIYPLLILWILIPIARVGASYDGVTLYVCQNANGVYQFSFTGDIDGWWINNAISYDLPAKTAVGAGAEFVVYYNGTTESISADPEGERCTVGPEGQWQPGAPSIEITLTSDCAWIEIDNHDGGWSRVQSDGKDVMLHYGDALIGGQDQSLDSSDYRAIPTNCY
jgi:hypothetical protein